MKVLIGSILASLIAITVAATEAPAQTFSWQQQRVGAIPTLPSHGAVSPIQFAAEQYHDAVAHFQNESRQVRNLDRFALRLVDRLEHSASDLCRTAKRTDNLSRLVYEVTEIESLQPRVEAAVFGSGCPIVRRALAGCWNEVRVAFAGLNGEIARLQAPVYGSHYGSRPGCDVATIPGLHSSHRFPVTDPRHSIGRPSIPHPTQVDPRFRHDGRDFGQRDFGSRGVAPVQRMVPNHPLAGGDRNDLGAMILSGFLSRVARGL